MSEDKPRYSVARRSQKWTDAEIQVIEDNLDKTAEQIYPSLPARSLAAINKRLVELRSIHKPAPPRVANPDEVKADAPAPDLADEILAKVQKRSGSEKQPYTLIELCNLLDRSPKAIEDAVQRLHGQGYRIELTATAQVDFAATQPETRARIPMEHMFDGDWVRIGALSDTHICNRHFRSDVLNLAYDYFQREGIRTVYHGGNWIDGEARFNKTELVTPPGFDNQVDRFLQEYPHREGISSYILSGDDHEGWYTQREGIDVGRRLEQSARYAGREDIIDLGYAECDIPIWAKGGKRPAMLRVIHPGGGSAYAISYAPQKTMESWSGGEKPDLALFAHWHKVEKVYYRNIWAIQTGCVCDQTLFMRKKRLAAHVGFWIIEFQVDSFGVITRLRSEHTPFFNEGYYRDRYAVTRKPTKVGDGPVDGGREDIAA